MLRHGLRPRQPSGLDERHVHPPDAGADGRTDDGGADCGTDCGSDGGSIGAGVGGMHMSLVQT